MTYWHNDTLTYWHTKTLTHLFPPECDSCYTEVKEEIVPLRASRDEVQALTSQVESQYDPDLEPEFAVRLQNAIDDTEKLVNFVSTVHGHGRFGLKVRRIFENSFQIRTDWPQMEQIWDLCSKCDFIEYSVDFKHLD